MDPVIFAESPHFALLGVGLAILMLWAGNIGALMSLPLLLAAGLTPEQAISIALFITAALIVPGVVGSFIYTFAWGEGITCSLSTNKLEVGLNHQKIVYLSLGLHRKTHL